MTLENGEPADVNDVVKAIANRSFLVNGKIVVTVASNNLNVALKTLAGSDASASDPIYFMVNGDLHTITAALSVTIPAGTNKFNAGSAELATKEIDYFVYLGYNATDGVVIGPSRIPYANQYSDFSATATNEKYCAISTITNAAATDYYVNIGRFAATLSAGAGYTWSVPTFTAKNLIQRPIYNTRWLTWSPVLTSGSADLSGFTAARYYISDTLFKFDFSAENKNVTGSAGFIGISLPFAVGASSAKLRCVGYAYPIGGVYAYVRADIGAGATQIAVFKDFTSANWLGSETGIYIYISSDFEL